MCFWPCCGFHTVRTYHDAATPERWRIQDDFTAPGPTTVAATCSSGTVRIDLAAAGTVGSSTLSLKAYDWDDGELLWETADPSAWALASVSWPTLGWNGTHFLYLAVNSDSGDPNYNRLMVRWIDPTDGTVVDEVYPTGPPDTESPSFRGSWSTGARLVCDESSGVAYVWQEQTTKWTFGLSTAIYYPTAYAVALSAAGAELWDRTFAVTGPNHTPPTANSQAGRRLDYLAPKSLIAAGGLRFVGIHQPIDLTWFSPAYSGTPGTDRGCLVMLNAADGSATSQAFDSAIRAPILAAAGDAAGNTFLAAQRSVSGSFKPVVRKWAGWSSAAEHAVSGLTNPEQAWRWALTADRLGGCVVAAPIAYDGVPAASAVVAAYFAFDAGGNLRWRKKWGITTSGGGLQRTWDAWADAAGQLTVCGSRTEGPM